MILEGNARAHGAELAFHLMNLRDNDHVSVHTVDGFIADDLRGAFAEIEAIPQATQCQKYLFSLSLNPPLGANVPEPMFEAVVKRAAKSLGLVGQPYALVFHEKLGRRHAHVVWSRIDSSTMKAINLPHFKRKLMALSRELYLEHGWDMPDGFKDRAARDRNRFDRKQAGQAKRAKRDPTALKAMFRGCWAQSDSAAGFSAALLEQGFVLARGDRRGLVAVDASGKVWSLSRWCGVKPRELRRKVPDDLDLPDVADATRMAQGLGPIKVPEREAERSAALEALVARQRKERADLLRMQKQAEIAWLKSRPSGLRFAFLKMTGQFARHVAKRDAERAQAAQEAQSERQSMISRHLEERRALERQHSLTPGFAQAARKEPGQSFEARKEETGLSTKSLRSDPSLILDALSKTEASFTRSDVLRSLSRWFTTLAELQSIADQALRSDKAVRLSSDGTPRYTTRDYLQAETQLLSATKALRQARGVGVSRANVSAALAAKNAEMADAFGGSLSGEQRKAIRSVLDERQLAQIVGLAGAGKSTMLSAARDAWQRQGIVVHGAALAGKAADGLQDSAGIPSRTLASLELSWENGHAPINTGDVLVIDEAGMVGTRQLSRVTAKCQEIGAKLVLVGDPEQLQPIEAGTPFRDLVARHGAAKLTEIHRQKTDWQRAASRSLADGETAKATHAYRERGAVSDHQTQDAAIEALAEQFAMDHLATPETSRLALVHRRHDVHALNQAIRNALRADGNQTEDTLLQTETGGRGFAPTDRIVFTRNDKELGVKNGMLGTVQHVAPDKVQVHLDGQPDKPVTFDPRIYRSFDHGYAVTIHKSQGATVDQSYVLASRRMDQHLAYVAMTRHREDLRVYLSRENAPKWSRQPRGPQIQGRNHARDGPSYG